VLLTRTQALDAPVRIVSQTPQPELEAAVRRVGYGSAAGDHAVVVVAADELDDRALVDIRAAREEEPEAVIVCLATKRLRRSGSALAAGADAVIADIDALPLAVTAAAGGHMLLPQHAFERRLKGRPTLSQRERELLALVVLGMTNGAIARRLHITESTVKSHLSSAFGKLAVRNRAEAVDLILSDEHLSAGIVSLPGARDRLTLLSDRPLATGGTGAAAAD
jgi:DNA-binding NarL/FixJ family response regulator